MLFRRFFKKKVVLWKNAVSVTNRDTAQTGAVSGGSAKFNTARITVGTVT
jgi:hypothetical protein